MNKMCEFKGQISEIRSIKDAPKKIICPECKRRIKPQLLHCGCGFDCACYIEVCVPRHKIKCWWRY